MNVKISKTFYSLFLFTAMAIVALRSEVVMESVKNSLIICFSSVIPALFPFMVLSSMFVSYSSDSSFGYVGKLLSRLFGISPCAVSALICGILCGYPIGAKCTAQLLESKKITVSEAESLIAYSNNSGPLFVIGAVGIGILHSAKAGVILYIIQLISALIAGILLRGTNYTSALRTPSHASQTKTLTSAICDSVFSILKVCGFVVFFGVINSLIIPLTNILPDILSCAVASFTEVTCGINYISSSLPTLSHKIIASSFALGWSGLSVHMQVKSIVSPLGLSMKKYYITRILMGTISAISAYTAIFQKDALILILIENKWLMLCLLGVLIFLIPHSKKERKPPYRKSPLFKKTI